MKFRTLFLIFLIGFCISACASPSTISSPDGSTEPPDIQEGDPGDIGSLIGTINDGIDEDNADNSSGEDVGEKNDDNLTADDCAKDPNAEMSGNQCVCVDRHFRVGDDDLCKQTCDDDHAKASKHGCGSCKSGYVKNELDRCVEPSEMTITSDAVREEFVIGGEVETLSHSFAAKGGSGQYSWSVSGLPEGLKQNKTTTTLTISGTPTKLGNFSITVTTKDKKHLVSDVSKSWELMVTHRPTIAIEGDDVSSGGEIKTVTMVAEICKNNVLSLYVSNGMTDYTWSLSDLTVACLSTDESSCTDSVIETNDMQKLHLLVNPCGIGETVAPDPLATAALVSIKAETMEGISESAQVDLNITFKQPPVFLAKEFEVTIKTADLPKAGTDSDIVFYVADKNGNHSNTTDFSAREGNDFEQGDERTYTHALKTAINMNDIEEFALAHYGNKGSPAWLIEGILIKAMVIDEAGDVEEEILYHNPCVLKWVNAQEIKFNLNDLAVCAQVATDNERDGDGIYSGTDNTVFLNINIDDISSGNWGDLHQPKMGPFLEKTSSGGTHSGLKLTLDWPEYNDHEKPGHHFDLDHPGRPWNGLEVNYYADFISTRDIDSLDVVSAYLKLGGEKDDALRTKGFQTYIFKPARIHSTQSDETSCWYIDGKADDDATYAPENEGVLQPGDTGTTMKTDNTDCAEIIRGVDQLKEIFDL
jgi:Putative Ig domain/PLAT/LH2 domain